MLNDIAWLQFLGALALVMPMFVVIVVVAFNDRSAQPVFPRWFGYQNIMTFLLFLRIRHCFFKAGPFAWNGALGVPDSSLATGGDAGDGAPGSACNRVNLGNSPVTPFVDIAPRRVGPDLGSRGQLWGRATIS